MWVPAGETEMANYSSNKAFESEMVWDLLRRAVWAVALGLLIWNGLLLARLFPAIQSFLRSSNLLDCH
jgi:hypothetical protein